MLSLILKLSFFFFIPYFLIVFILKRLKRFSAVDKLSCILGLLTFIFWYLWILFLPPANKGITNAQIELFFSGVFLSVFVVLVIPKLQKVHRVLSIIVVGITVSGFFVHFFPPISHYNKLSAFLYISKNSDLAPEIKTAILNGKILLGMNSEQAIIAGGPYHWTSKEGTLKKLTFNNLSQFDTEQPKAFSVNIVNDLISGIEELNDLNDCKLELKEWDKDKFKYAGFWMKQCSDGFGLRFTPTQSGRYTERFCGPGGCGDPTVTPLDCTALPSEPDYLLVNENTMKIRTLDTYEMYTKCAQ